VKLILQRLTTTEHGTFGVLTTSENERICVTLEEPRSDNARSVSRILAGIYSMFRRFSPKRKYFVLELRGVPGRGNIQIHIGNILAHTEGCILVGMRHGLYKGVTPGVLDSRAAFKNLMALTQDARELTLEVRDHA
jgi:hypothetical protein